MKTRTVINIALIVGLIAIFIVSPRLRALLGFNSSTTVSIDIANSPAGATQETANSKPVEQEYELVTLLSKDAIPSIDNPRFVTGEEADAQYSPDELVLGIEIDGDARAYSIPFLSGHEIVNDEIADQPIAVTW